MSDLANQVSEPILNSAFAEPEHYWYLQEGRTPEKREGRRKSLVFQPNEQRVEWDLRDGTLARSTEYGGGYELLLVNRIRERVKQWRAAGYPGVTRTTRDLLKHWTREGRRQPLFFAQIEAAETIIFLTEAPLDLRQGINIPRDLRHGEKDSKGGDGFVRYASKLATGTGKTTVMAMLAAWSILNKVTSRADKRFSDAVLVVCPNVTIRSRLQELDPVRGDASLYRTRDLVSAEQMPLLAQGKVIVTNWHVFEPQAPSVNGERSRVLKIGVPVTATETITIGTKNDTARGKRFLTEETFQAQLGQGLVEVLEESRDSSGRRTIKARITRYIESDAKLLRRMLGQDVAGRSNLLVLNDEAHHAYRVRVALPDDWDTLAEDEQQLWLDERDEATVWVEGLDRVNWNGGKGRGINFCIDLSATPYFLGHVGQETNRPFQWTVSDFGLMDSIESGLVKIPQLAVRDTTGKEVAGFFNIWKYVMDKLTPGERGGTRAQPRPAAILKYAALPIGQLAGLWREEFYRWKEEEDEQRSPVFIVVCKNIKIATAVYQWLAEDIRPDNIGSTGIEEFRNRPERGERFTIRVDTKVASETDSGKPASDELTWMRYTLDSVGKLEWPKDVTGRIIYPEGFEALATKLERPMHPPGRDVRCIVSVAMLTEGWDCNTVTHVVGLRPFMSQLLCEQVVGRALRRRRYDEGENGRFSEELAKVFGVPFEIVPFKESDAPPPGPKERRHVFALPERANLEIRFPRVLRYEQVIKRVVDVDWEHMANTELDPQNVPAEVQIQGLAINNEGKMRFGAGFRVDTVTLDESRKRFPLQRVEFAFASQLTQALIKDNRCSIPAQRLFPQVLAIVRRYMAEHVVARKPFERVDVWHSPFYGLALGRMREAIRGDVDAGEDAEQPVYDPGRETGSTADVDFWTSKEVREVVRSHLNYAVADTKQWEQSAAYHLERSPSVYSFVKNSYDPLGTRSVLGFTIPYKLEGETHEYVPDFIVQLNAGCNLKLILETKGFPDAAKDDKGQAAQRWVRALNLDGRHGEWGYEVAEHPSEVSEIVERQVKLWREPMPGIHRSIDVCGGEACIGETRIPVWVVEQGRRLGMSDETLLQNYPSLSPDDLANAWSYVASHRAEVERDIRLNEDDETD